MIDPAVYITLLTVVNTALTLISFGVLLAALKIYSEILKIRELTAHKEKLKKEDVVIIPPRCGASHPETSWVCWEAVGHDGQHRFGGARW